MPNELMSPQESTKSARDLARQRWILTGIILAVLLILAGLFFAVYGLTRNEAVTANIRDIFIIFMAFESLIIGAALIVLVFQVASLINLLQNEVKPILKATTDTVNTLRGTTEFLSEHMVEPVIKLNSYLSGLRKFFNLFGMQRK